MSNVVEGPGAKRYIPGQFKPGHSVRSPGRPPKPSTFIRVAKQNIIEQARASENDVMAMFINIALDPHVPEAVRIVAGREVIHRARGVPVSASEMIQTNDPVRMELASAVADKAKHAMHAPRSPGPLGPTEQRVAQLEQQATTQGKKFAESE